MGRCSVTDEVDRRPCQLRVADQLDEVCHNEHRRAHGGEDGAVHGQVTEDGHARLNLPAEEEGAHAEKHDERGDADVRDLLVQIAALKGLPDLIAVLRRGSPHALFVEACHARTSFRPHVS